MTDTTPQMQITDSSLPALAGTAVRYASALLSGWLIRKGYLTGADEPLVLGLLLALTSIGYAFWRTIQIKRQTRALVSAVPDEVAVLK